ncbi:hypothetical protein POM88_038755 [Heracleum sosnowskyi]|uniref:Uncharacterized protein n=1 Tax=Heracleum sosnowskyi TaxID=360622 RepID=A0AAD8HB93_9APIA|nr:hypothetical protein POM88_038755 [Heracleum sosnowskyi]
MDEMLLRMDGWDDKMNEIKQLVLGLYPPSTRGQVNTTQEDDRGLFVMEPEVIPAGESIEPEVKKMGIEKTCATSVAKDKIFVHALRNDGGGFQFSEFCTLDMRNGKVSDCPYALLADTGFNSMVSLGSVVYLVGARRPEQIRCKTQPPHSRCTKKALYHKFMSYLDLANDTGDGWKEAPCLPTGPTPNPVVLAFGGKIYVFHTNGDSKTAHVFDPVSNQWETLLPPPGVKFFDSHYASSAVLDTENNRILVYFERVHSVFAYYPANNQWERVLKPFSWSHKIVFVDGVIYFYLPEAPELVAAYHIATEQRLNVVFTSKLSDDIWINAYDTMFHLGDDVMCLAAYSCDYSVGTDDYCSAFYYMIDYEFEKKTLP